MLKHFNRTESTAKIITDQNDFNLDTKMPNFKGNKTPYLNTDSKKFSKSINKWDLGDTVMPKYLQDDMRFQLPSAIKSRESYNIPSDRKSEHYMCNWTSEKLCETHSNYFWESGIKKDINKPIFSSRKMDRIMHQHIEKSNSYESVSLNKTIDLEEMQKEVDKIKSKMRQARMNIIECNRISNETIYSK